MRISDWSSDVCSSDLAVRKEKLHYKAGGLDMEGWLCMDETQEGRRPAVLVFPEAPGLGDHAKWRAEQLAAKGYVALACDLHGGGTLLTDYDNMMATVGKDRKSTSLNSSH